ncbi:hypothetical protein ACQY0O_000455 [Thecaphora frezii]
MVRNLALRVLQQASQHTRTVSTATSLQSLRSTPAAPPSPHRRPSFQAFRSMSSSTTMASLAASRCEPCSNVLPALGSDGVAELLPTVPGWYLSPQPQTLKAAKEANPDALKKSFRFKDWATAQAFAASLGQAAEEEGHHPAIMVEWGRVSVWWWSHSIRGLHKNDFVMASKTDELAAQAEGYKPLKLKST